jgi:hypothetical protein
MKADAFSPEDDAPLRVPPWVPEPVAQAAHDIYAYREVANRRRMIACLVRLVSDERMRRVWYELARRHRGGTFMHPATTAPAWSPLMQEAKVDPPPSKPDECQDVAMANLLRASLVSAIQPGTTMTRQQAESDRRRYLAMAQLWIGPPIRPREDRDRHRLLASAARAYEKAAANIVNKLEGKFSRFPIIRKRGHGGSANQWLALNITGQCRWLFGSPLYGVTAIVMSVILDRDINARTVRQWCAHPADKPPKSTR